MISRIQQRKANVKSPFHDADQGPVMAQPAVIDISPTPSPSSSIFPVRTTPESTLVPSSPTSFAAEVTFTASPSHITIQSKHKTSISRRTAFSSFFLSRLSKAKQSTDIRLNQRKKTDILQVEEKTPWYCFNHSVDRKELDEASRRLESLVEERKVYDAEIERLDMEIERQNREIEGQDWEIKRQDKDIGRLEQEVERQEKQLEVEREEHKKQVDRLHKELVERQVTARMATDHVQALEGQIDRMEGAMVRAARSLQASEAARAAMRVSLRDSSRLQRRNSRRVVRHCA